VSDGRVVRLIEKLGGEEKKPKRGKDYAGLSLNFDCRIEEEKKILGLLGLWGVAVQCPGRVLCFISATEGGGGV